MFISFLCLRFLKRIKTGCTSCIWEPSAWLFFLVDRKWIFCETKLKKNIEVWLWFSKLKFYVSVLLLIIKISQSACEKWLKTSFSSICSETKTKGIMIKFFISQNQQSGIFNFNKNKNGYMLPTATTLRNRACRYAR